MPDCTVVAPETIHEHILATFEDIDVHQAWGETSFFYNPGHRFARGTYFLTIKSKDGANDSASMLGRDGVFRLNMGLPKVDYIALFGPPPRRPAKGCTIDAPWDFTTLDCLMPHPVYGWMSWVCVLSPGAATFQTCLPLIEKAYRRAQQLAARRLAREGAEVAPENRTGC